MKAALVLAALALAGCDRPLTNEEIAQQVEYCRDHGLKPELYRQADLTKSDPVIVAIQCQPKEEK